MEGQRARAAAGALHCAVLWGALMGLCNRGDGRQRLTCPRRSRCAALHCAALRCAVLWGVFMGLCNRGGSSAGLLCRQQQ